MPENSLSISEYVHQMSALLNLEIPADYEASVIDNFSRIQTLSELVLEFPLPEEVEVAPRFQP